MMESFGAIEKSASEYTVTVMEPHDSCNHKHEDRPDRCQERQPASGDILDVLVRISNRYHAESAAALDRVSRLPLFGAGYIKESYKVLFAPVTCCIAEIRETLRRRTHTQ